MRHDVLMPAVSDEVEEGVLVTWFVEPGATVAEGDLVAEVQVQKVSIDVNAPVAGRVAELLAVQGDAIRQGTPIAVIETAGTAAEVPGGEVSGMPAAAAPVGAAATPTGAPLPSSPAARRVAGELGVDLAAVRGSGPGGRIVEEDVRAAAAGAPPAPAPAAAPGAMPVPGGGRLAPISPVRRAIADRLQGWLSSTAQLTLTAEADVTDLEGLLAERSAAWGRRASYTEAAVRALALALRDHPGAGARWTDRGLALPEGMHIGVAVALEEGLIVPVVRHADTKDLERLNAEVADLAERARDGRLAPAETEGGVASVTNLGAYGIDAFTPLLNPPQTAILGLGRARPRPAIVDGAVAVRTLVVLSLTFDHRVIDGAPAAAVLAEVVDLLEHADRL